MKDRCNRKACESYKYYGGRGISVCKDWNDSYETFRNWALSTGYDDNLTIERIDVNGNYCPENCTWIPHVDQASNKTTSFLITYNGQTKTCQQWSREIGIHAHTLSHRIKDLGWSIEDAMSLSPRARSQRYDVFGEQLTISEMSKKYGIPVKRISARIIRGWSPERAVSE